MSEEDKGFWAEQGLTMGLFGATIALMVGKLAFGWAISWLWVFAPLWMPFAGVLTLIGMLMVVIGMVFVGVVGVVGVATYFDKDFMDNFGVEETEETVEEEEPVVEENETLQ